MLSEHHLLHIPGKMYEQVKGAAMESPLSPIVANLFMEDLETRALATSPSTPKMWKRFVDDTFTIIQKADKDAFLDHINSIDSNIHFTYEDPKEYGSIPFLDMLITPDEEGRLNTNVYRKPTHTDQYLHVDSHDAITSKYSMIGTIYHRARTVCSNPNQLQNEETHLFKSLSKCKYPNWALNRVKLKSQTSAQKKSNENSNKTAPNNSSGPKTHIVVPYYQGPSESFNGTCTKYGIEVHLKGSHTIKDLLMAPKDKDPILKRSGVIYRYIYDRVDCDHEYIGESARNFEERL